MHPGPRVLTWSFTSPKTSLASKRAEKPSHSPWMLPCHRWPHIWWWYHSSAMGWGTSLPGKSNQLHVRKGSSSWNPSALTLPSCIQCTYTHFCNEDLAAVSTELPAVLGSAAGQLQQGPDAASWLVELRADLTFSTEISRASGPAGFSPAARTTTEKPLKNPVLWLEAGEKIASSVCTRCPGLHCRMNPSLPTKTQWAELFPKSHGMCRAWPHQSEMEELRKLCAGSRLRQAEPARL